MGKSLPKNMRKINIDNRELLNTLNEKSKLQKEIDKRVEKFKDITKKTDELKAEIEKLQLEYKNEYDKVKSEVLAIDEELKPYLTKVQRYKDKINPIVAKSGIELGEYEIITETMIENGKVTVVIEDLVENYKEKIKKQLNDQRGNKTNTKEEGK